MNVDVLRARMLVDGREVRQVVDTYDTVWTRRGRRMVATGTRPVRRVTFHDGTKQDYEAGAEIAAVGYVERLPGGPVASKLAGKASRVRAHDGRWAGESGRLGELTTWKHDQLTRMTGWDPASVNGRVGVTA